MISPELASEIRRLSTVEGWRIHVIARQLGIHHSTVRRALDRFGVVEPPRQRCSILDPYLHMVRETLERYPDLPASELYEMVRRRGYPGGPDHFRHLIAELGLRPRKVPEAYFRLRTLPGEQAQVDWAHFGEREVEGGRRRLLGFVMVLSYSRKLFVRFFYDARMPSFLAGHVLAFDFFGGVARRVLYDNLKSAVLERRDEAVRFHPRLLELADYYGYSPRPVAPRRGNEKGRVERAIRYLRTSFFPLRQNLSLEDLNREALVWCRQRASQRPWPQQRQRTVEQAYQQERAHLLSLPPEPFPCHEIVAVLARRQPYVRFDANRYSVPPAYLARPLSLHAELDRVRIFDRHELIASHERCWGKQQQIEDPDHLEALRQAKGRARLSRGQNQLLQAVPQAEQLLTALARRQGQLAGTVTHLLEWLDAYGIEELRAAVAEALETGSAHPESVRLVLDRRRHQQGKKPPIALNLADHPKLQGLLVTPHRLADYDPDEGQEES